MKQKNIVTNLAIILFISFVTASVYISHQSKISDNQASNTPLSNLKLYTEAEFDSLIKLNISNKNGDFTFEKTNKSPFLIWEMITPRQIAANSNFFEKISLLFKNSNVKKIFPDDKINNSNFSLEKPLATLTLLFKDGHQNIVYIGLLNTIDNSLYLKIKNRQGIYHIESPDFSFENATIAEFIESQVFNLNFKNISNVNFNNFKNNAQLDLQLANAEWLINNKDLADTNKLQTYFQDLSNLKASFVLDKLTDQQKSLVNNLKKNAEYKMLVKDLNQNTIEFHIGPMIKEFAGIDLKGESFYLVTHNLNSNIYLLSKESYDLYNVKIDQFKK